ncbi:MAG TPA: hypothetical protein VLM38_14005 [Blastocatellia bacterium]|nr:hypothetical protein [Blastocatellia bacterium]
MKESEPKIDDELLQRPARLSVQSLVIGLILIITVPGSAQEMNKSRKGYHMSVQEQTPEPNPDLKSLSKLIGTWKVSDPSGKNAINGTESYEWMEGGFFVMHRFDFVHYGHIVRGIEIIGHEHAFGAEPGTDIRSRIYDTRGNTLDYVYEVDKETLTIWGGEKGSPAYFKGKFSDDGNTCTGGWVYPGGGGYQATMTRIKK